MSQGHYAGRSTQQATTTVTVAISGHAAELVTEAGLAEANVAHAQGAWHCSPPSAATGSSPATPFSSTCSEHISRLIGHSGTAVTEAVRRQQIRPVMEEGATAMDAIFAGNGPYPIASEDEPAKGGSANEHGGHASTRPTGTP
jgi:hypothetical protein